MLTPIDDRIMDEEATLSVPLTAVNLDDDVTMPILSADGLPVFAVLTDNGDGTRSKEFNPGF